MEDVPDQTAVLAIKVIMDQHALNVRYQNVVLQCEDIKSISMTF